MSEIEELRRAYEDFARLPWEPAVAGEQRVWFAIYEPEQERRLRCRLQDFQNATVASGHGWSHLDLTDSFPAWLAGQDYHEEYFMQPADLSLAIDEFRDHLVASLSRALANSSDNDVLAITGTGGLFELTRVSALVARVSHAIKGRLLVFFPGRREGSNYRLLDAHDGWNYLAVPIESKTTK